MTRAGSELCLRLRLADAPEQKLLLSQDFLA